MQREETHCCSVCPWAAEEVIDCPGKDWGATGNVLRQKMLEHGTNTIKRKKYSNKEAPLLPPPLLHSFRSVRPPFLPVFLLNVLIPARHGSHCPVKKNFALALCDKIKQEVIE